MTGAPSTRGRRRRSGREHVDAGMVWIHIQPAVRTGDNIRPIGADLRAGDLLIATGTRLGPAEVGLLASLGHARVRVGRTPRSGRYLNR